MDNRGLCIIKTLFSVVCIFPYFVSPHFIHLSSNNTLTLLRLSSRDKAATLVTCGSSKTSAVLDTWAVYKCSPHPTYNHMIYIKLHDHRPEAACTGVHWFRELLRKPGASNSGWGMGKIGGLAGL